METTLQPVRTIPLQRLGGAAFMLGSLLFMKQDFSLFQGNLADIDGIKIIVAKLQKIGNEDRCA